MTLLNTVANLGAKWPPSLALYGVDALSAAGVAAPVRLELAASTALGVAWLFLCAPAVRRLQDTPPQRWRPTTSGRPVASP